MSFVVEVDNVSAEPSVPSDRDISRWVIHALQSNTALNPASELSVRIVDSDEIQSLNRQYRQKDKPTNVLSFPAELPEGIDIPLLGDIVICATIVADEAKAQGKAVDDHWAHMLIHGTLHLLGYDHIDDGEAEEMEQLEIKLLAVLGINSPY